MDLVGVSPARDVEQVCDVLCARATVAGSCESRILQACNGAVKPSAWVAHHRLVVREGDVDARVEVRVGDELACPLLLFFFGDGDVKEVSASGPKVSPGVEKKNTGMRCTQRHPLTLRN